MKRKLKIAAALLWSMVSLVSSYAHAETRSYEAKDGSRIVYEETGAGSQTLVFIHCLSCNRNYWKNQVPEFSKNYRLLLIDLPGHGDSRAGEKFSKTIAAMGKDVAELLNSLDVKNAILVGSSMGGPISLEVARLSHSRVLGIVGVDNLHNVEAPYPKDQFNKMADQMAADYDGAMRNFIPHLFPPKVDPKVVAWAQDQAAKSCEPQVCVSLIRSFPDMDLAKMMKKAKVPIRNINAVPYTPESPKTNVAVNRKYADFDAIEMTEVGHFIMLEKPEEFNANLKKQIQAILEVRRK